MQNLGCAHTKNLSSIYQKLTCNWTSVFYLAKILVAYSLSSPPSFLATIQI